MEQGILYLAQCGIEFQNELLAELNQFNFKNDDTSYSSILKNRFSNLPLMSSFIYELLRMHGFVRQTFGRDMTDKSVKIGNYILPKGTIFVANLAAMNHNNDYWTNLNNNQTNPFVFNPKRFINSTGRDNKFSLKNEMAIFGYGRRDCPGKELAMRELYLLFSILIKRYQFHIPSNFKSSQDYLLHIPTMFEDPNTPMIGVSLSMRKQLVQESSDNAYEYKQNSKNT